MTLDTTYLKSYEDQGFVIIPDLIAPEDFPELQAACERAIARTRSGAWKYRRTVGAQFPPYDDKNDDSWGVQHVMHPDLGEPAFVRWYTSDRLCAAVTALLGCREDELQMELFNLLINPKSHKFALRWHRDDVREDASTAEEVEALKKWSHGVQWNTALYEDGCLFVVPGSHRVPRTDGQRAHSTSKDAPVDPLAMPGAIRVVLKPGETVFYNSNILHLGTYDPAEKRATLHACVGDTRGGSTRARNVLQHGLAWMGAGAGADSEPGSKTETDGGEGDDSKSGDDAGKRFVQTLPNERARVMWRNLRRMQQEAGTEAGEGEAGYSQVN